MDRVVKMRNSVSSLIYLIYNNKTGKYMAYSPKIDRIINENISPHEANKNFIGGFWKKTEE